LEDFFDYLKDGWGPLTEVSKFYAGAHPWHIIHNQGIEGKNRHIKKSHTFKARVSIGKLFDIIHRMLQQWSEQDDSILFDH
jgi:hypothetical protein